MKVVSETITPFEMAKTYWRNLRFGAFDEVSARIESVMSEEAKKYWNEVLSHLMARHNRRRKLH